MFLQPNTLSKIETPTAAIAQLGERQTEDLKVPGSIPGLGIMVWACDMGGGSCRLGACLCTAINP